jgi:ribosomal protein S18 acetylase RimI-like enzyme
VLLSGSEKVGIATTVSFGKVGWFGNLIVIESYRNRGGGSVLVEHSIEYLTSINVETVGLYAYINRIPFYRRLGFEYDSEFVVLKGKGFSSPAGTNVKEAEKQDVQKIIENDCSCFGACRRKSLEPILLDPDNLCYVYTEDGKMSGYVLAKIYRGMAELGPLVCRQGRSDIAVDLLKNALNRLKDFDVSMCIPKKEKTILNMLIGAGFSENFQVARMFFGPAVTEQCIYLAESLERG